MRVRQTCYCAMLLVLVAGLSGCINVQVGDIGGDGDWGHRSKGSYAVVRPIAGGRGVLGVYDGIQVWKFADGTGGRVPPMFMAHLSAEIRAELNDEKLPYGPGRRTMMIQGTLARYGVDVLARVELVDGSTRQVLGVADCIGSTGETDPNKAVRKKAKGMAKAIVEWIASRYPERDD